MKIVQTMRDIINTLSEKQKTKEEYLADIRLKTSVALLMCLASIVLTVLNIVWSYWFMMWTTTVLSVGFAIGALLCGKFKKRLAADILMAAMATYVFSVYAITGQNEGFAILWILLVPPIGMNLVGLEIGLIVSAYFQLFLVVLFYTPLRAFVDNTYYADTFFVRFPVLYLTSFAAATLLTVQKLYYSSKARSMAYTDALTGLKNRRYYEQVTTELLECKDGRELTLITADIDRLKYTNDKLGHQAGDELIMTAASFLTRFFPEAEIIARMGGDEFCVLIYLSKRETEERLKKLKEELALFRGTYIVSPSMSVGVASAHPSSAYELSLMEKEADNDMYEDKSAFYRNVQSERCKR